MSGVTNFGRGLKHPRGCVRIEWSTILRTGLAVRANMLSKSAIFDQQICPAKSLTKVHLVLIATLSALQSKPRPFLESSAQGLSGRRPQNLVILYNRGFNARFHKFKVSGQKRKKNVFHDKSRFFGCFSDKTEILSPLCLLKLLKLVTRSGLRFSISSVKMGLNRHFHGKPKNVKIIF